MERRTILVVDDEAVNLRLTREIFLKEGFEVVTEDSGAAAFARISEERPAIVLLDVRMHGLSGLETLGKIRTIAPDLPVVMLTAYAEVPAAVEAIRLGADDFIVRPIENDKLVLTVRRVLERRELQVQVRSLRGMLGRDGYMSKLMVASPGIRKIVEQAQQVARSSLTVLIQGETGTGKELVARAIHHESDRSERSFVAVDCGALPATLVESELFGYVKGAFSGADRNKDGHFQAAEGGTLLLDEVENLSLSAQATLLRAVQEKQVRPVGATRPRATDVRLIAASNDNLEKQVEQGQFRQDLYYRLSEFVITVPPLRERREDILPLARAFQEEACVEMHRSVLGLSERAVEYLQCYRWPGNVRELRNAIRRAVLQCGGLKIDPEDLAIALESGAGSVEPLETSRATDGVRLRSLKEIAGEASGAAERSAIVEALNKSRGNKTEAARILGIRRQRLYDRLKRYDL